MTEYEELTKQEAKLLLSAIGSKNCDTCKKKITENNFGLLHKTTYSCNEIFCLVHAVDKIEEACKEAKK